MEPPVATSISRKRWQGIDQEGSMAVQWRHAENRDIEGSMAQESDDELPRLTPQRHVPRLQSESFPGIIVIADVRTGTA